MEFRTCLVSAWCPSHPQTDVQGEFLCVHGRVINTLQPLSSCPHLPWGDRTHRCLGQQLLGSLKHFLLWAMLQWGSNTNPAGKQCWILVFLKKKNYKKDFIFLNVLCEKCLFLSSYWEIPNTTLATTSVRPEVFTLCYLLGLIMFSDFSLKSEHSGIADISWCILYIYVYIYIYQICCWYRAAVSMHWPAPFFPCPWWPAEHRDVVWQHQDTLGATDCQWPPWPGHRRLKTSQMLWWRLLLLLCHCVLAHFVSTLLRDASFFHQKFIHSSQQLGWDSEGKTREVVQFVNKTLNWRWVFQKALTLLDKKGPVQMILVTAGAVLSARLKC